jgi:hypothetical protein
MRPEAIAELRRRCNILIENSIPGDIGTGMSGSKIRFMSALAVVGYPFTEPCAWMDEEYIKPVLTREEFDSDIYDNFLKNLFEEAYTKVNKETENG